MRLHQAGDAALSLLANGAWKVARFVNDRKAMGRFQPKWAPAPLPKSFEKTKPPLGTPRETDSLCPQCVFETREKVLAGDLSVAELVKLNPGEVKARIFEEDGAVWMEKTCAKHGTVRDRMATDARFFQRMEKLFPGRDFGMVKDQLHQHGHSTIRYGRGAVLTIDLTNRCNMMCDPCFMDANQVGFVHEMTLEDVKKILDDATTVTPRRQLSVQFSGGEPTLSPFFLEAVAHAKKCGFEFVQAASNGIRFAQDLQFCKDAKAAGLHFVYLQFDAATNEEMAHRGVGNLFEVKQQAIDNLYAAGVTVALVVTVVNTVNNQALKGIFDFTLKNIHNIHTISFQPVSFTGRDEHISDEQRQKWRYTLADLAKDFSDQTGLTNPIDDWYPLSATGTLSDLADVARGSTADWGTVKCGCHPNCGIGTYVMVDMTTKECTPVPRFIRLERFLEDVTKIADWSRSRKWTAILTGISLLRNFRPTKAPRGMKFWDLLRQVDSHTGGGLGISHVKRFRWGLLTIAGMWFQDVFNYDFRRTEMCIIPYATQAGEISFCAYNTGIGWRKIVEKMHGVSLSKWYREKGRHAVYAKGREVDLTAAGTQQSREEAEHFEQVVPRSGPLLAPPAPKPADAASNATTPTLLPVVSSN
jgi:uncharacterized radical SAM superfamily Fe-S cluster-containing enzyme